MARALAFGQPEAPPQPMPDVTERQVWLAAYICRMGKYTFKVNEWPGSTDEQRRASRARGCKNSADDAADAFKERFGG